MAAPEADVAAFENDKFAMDKYSRQVGEFGVAAMAKLVQMKILVIGLKGVGIEVAKNLILAGVGQVTLYDDDIVKISDLGTNFYLTELDVNKKKVAEASLGQLKSLNPLVNVTIHSGRLTNKDTKKFTVVVDCGLTSGEALVCDQQCRKPSANTKFIRSRVHGLVGYMFNDFGDKFTCVDKSGEQPISRVIDKIESDPENPNELIVRLIAEKRHNIDFDGHVNFIKFDELEGALAVLNNKEKPFEVKENKRIKTDGKEAFDPFSIRVIIPDLELKEVMYTGSGQIVQVKKAVDLKFKSLEASLVNPINPEEGMLAFTDGTKFGRPEQLHIGLNGLWRYEAKHKSLPPANSTAAIQEVVKYAKEYNELMKTKEGALSVEAVDEDVVAKLACYAECNFQPLCAFFGGIVAQEVVKYTGKYTPMNQWLHIDCFEVLPEEMVDAENEESFAKVQKIDRLPVGSRYDDLIQILGKPLHEKLMKSSTFMVGCGALGCELLKNFALMGLACSENGLITVTDNDQIEISNLSRQFLFREENVGQPKSLAAGKAVAKMNPEINVKSMENLVSPASETVFNSDFWQGLDFVTNALDNVKARKYVDSQCVFYGKPLLESGTLGTKCNSQVIIPHMTASYADGPTDDLGEAIPMCTLRNFPSQIEHCIEWARARFTDLFESNVTKATNFMKDPETFMKDMSSKKSDLSAVATELPSLQKVLHILKTASDSETSFQTCVEEAYSEFHSSYRDKILALIRAKPEDTLDEDNQPFWGKNRRFPQAANFDIEDETHISFVLSMANILSMNYGLVSSTKEFEQNALVVKNIVASLKPPATLAEDIDLSTEGEEESKKKAAGKNELEEFEKILSEFKEFAQSSGFKTAKVEPASFEKDDDSNFHIDYVTASSNLRAWNYKMKNVSRHKCKMIAGRIIPAIATTTAAVTGIVCIEMLKLIQPGKKLAAFKDTSDSLGVNMYQFMEPPTPIEEKKGYDVLLLADVLCLPEKFTKWDKTIIESKDKDLTLSEFFAKLKALCMDKYEKDLTVTMLYHPNGDLEEVQGSGKKIYDDGGAGEDKMDVPMKEIIAEIYGKNALGLTSVPLKIIQEDDEGTLYKIPELVYVFA